MKLVVVGATGMVGQVMLKVLEERNFPVTELIPVASQKSVGESVVFRGKEVKIVSLEQAVALHPNLAIFSAGGDISKEWAPRFAQIGTRVVDNSSAWRMDPTKKLVVPEINADVLTEEDYIIANPNCSTIQLVMVLYPLHLRYKIKRVIVSTYQSVTGTGKYAVDQLNQEISNSLKGISNDEVKKIYPHEIFKNALPHCDVFSEEGYTKEELKLVNEPLKIMRDNNIRITATAVRVPVQGGHSESVNIEFENDFDLDEVKDILSKSSGIILQDKIENNVYPMPLYSEGKDEVFVGRLRRDFSQPKALNAWIVADNLRKGAATNTIQIAEYLVGKGWV